VEFKSVVVGPEQVLGESAATPDIVSDYLTTNRTFQAAAVIGFLKKICGEFFNLNNFFLSTDFRRTLRVF
jgi:hypothetical protein